MHVRTNIEHNIIQVIIISLCPLLAVLSSCQDALLLSLLTFVCFFISAIVCSVFNKYMSRNVKIFITAILSTFIVTIFNYYLKENPVWIFEASDSNFLAVLSTICLCVDVYFIQTQAVSKNHFFTILANSALFIFIVMLYSIVCEILGYGTVFGEKLFENFSGSSFCLTITFKLLWLGLLGVSADAIYRIYFKHMEKRRVAYGKFIRKIRDEKKFQYDSLRRKKLLVSPVEINTIRADEAREIEERADTIVDLNSKKGIFNFSENTVFNRKKRVKKGKKQPKIERVFTSKNGEGGHK